MFCPLRLFFFSQVNSLSSKDLKDLFKLYEGTPSDTHDKLRCKRYAIHDVRTVSVGSVSLVRATKLTSVKIKLGGEERAGEKMGRAEGVGG